MSDDTLQLHATAGGISATLVLDGAMKYALAHNGISPLKEAVTLPRLRKTLAAHRLAFGQPRQEERIGFLGADRSDADLLLLASRLRIDLSPPQGNPS